MTSTYQNLKVEGVAMAEQKLTPRDVERQILVNAIVDMARSDATKLRDVATWALNNERHSALTDAAEMLDNARQPAGALGVILLRDKRR